MLTDPKKFRTDEDVQETFDWICNRSWMRLSSDFYIEKWSVYADEQLVIQNDLLLSLQARGEVWFVEDVFDVYFFQGTREEVMERLEEYALDVVHRARDQEEIAA